MKVHELINVLNHFPPGAEVVNPPEQVKADDGTVFSVSGTYDTLKDGSGHSLAVRIAPDSAAATAATTTGAASGDASAAALATVTEG
jgi:hypothetical protein